MLSPWPSRLVTAFLTVLRCAIIMTGCNKGLLTTQARIRSSLAEPCYIPTWEGIHVYEGHFRAEVGCALIQAREWYREDLVASAVLQSGVPRDQLFLTSKLHPRHLGKVTHVLRLAWQGSSAS